MGLPGGSALRLADRLLASGVCPSEALRQEELRVRVRTALEALAEADREVLVLRYLEQLSAQEVGAVLGVSESAAKKRALRDSAIFRNNLGIALARAGQLREALAQETDFSETTPAPLILIAALGEVAELLAMVMLPV